MRVLFGIPIIVPFLTTMAIALSSLHTSMLLTTADDSMENMMGHHQQQQQRLVFLDSTATAVPQSSGLSMNELETLNFFCVTWDEVNLDEWWTHHVEYIIRQENTTHQCFQRDPNPERALYLKQIHDNQFNRSSCATNVHLRNLWVGAGWGACLNHIIDGLIDGLKEGRPYVHRFEVPQTHGWWNYAAAKETGANATCPSRGTECYFLNYSSCVGSDYYHYKGTQVSGQIGNRPIANKLRPWAYLYFTRSRQWLRKEVAIHVAANKPPWFHENNPDAPDDDKMGSIVAAKEAPTHDTALRGTDIHKPATTSFSRVKCSIIHVRRSDSILLLKGNDRIYHPLSDYLDRLPADRRQPGSKVLLLTDDANAIDEANEFHSEINWHYFNRTRHRGTVGGFANHQVSKTPREDVVIIMATFVIAQKCDAMVRGQSSFGDAIARMVDVSCSDRGISCFSDKIREKRLNETLISTSAVVLEEQLAQRRAAKGKNAKQS